MRAKHQAVVQRRAGFNVGYGNMLHILIAVSHRQRRRRELGIGLAQAIHDLLANRGQLVILSKIDHAQCRAAIVRLAKACRKPIARQIGQHRLQARKLLGRRRAIQQHHAGAKATIGKAQSQVLTNVIVFLLRGIAAVHYPQDKHALELLGGQQLRASAGFL